MPGFTRRSLKASGGILEPKLYLTPSQGDFSVGNTVVCEIRENSYYTAVNALQANLSYPSTLLQFQSISTAGSPFTDTIQDTGGSGSIQLGVALLGGSVSDDQLVGKVTFTVIASGSASIDFVAGSGAASADTSTNVIKRQFGASYALA